MRKQHLVKSTPRNEPNKRKHDDGPTPEQIASRRRHYETVKEARVQMECRSHVRGRCIHGDECTALHLLPGHTLADLLPTAPGSILAVLLSQSVVLPTHVSPPGVSISGWAWHDALNRKEEKSSPAGWWC